MRIAVIGAGIAGLCAAYRLRDRHDVTLFEARRFAGGNVHSQHVDGFVFEWGPNGFLSNAADLLQIVRELGLESSLVEANALASKRFIFWNGKLHALPAKPQQALTTSLISPIGKFRALRELFRKPAEPPADETVAQFFTRHFGAQVAQRIVAPAVLGISGGDAGQTSIAALFPRLPEIEREYGSVLRGMMRGGGMRAHLMSFGSAGLQRLTDALAQALGERVRFDSPVEMIARSREGWAIGGERYDAVVVAAPAGAASKMLAGCDAVLGDLLARIRYAPMRVAGIAYRSKDVPVALDGFGFLAARNSGVRILGALYTSAMFARQAPPDVAYLRVFLGGSSDKAVAELDEAQLRGIVRADLRATLKITAEPIAFHEHLWRVGIPQYGLDHPRLVAEIAERVRRLDGLTLAGNAYRGIGVGDTAKNAMLAVATL